MTLVSRSLTASTPPYCRAANCLSPCHCWGSRAIVTAWVLTTVPLLAASLVFLAVHVPSLLAKTARSIDLQSEALVTAGRIGAVHGAALSGLHLVLLAGPLVGITVTMARVVGRGRQAQVHRRLGRLVLRFGAPRS